MFSIAGLAINAGSAERTERDLQTAIAAIEAAAQDLTENEELSPAVHPDPQRVVDIQVPADSVLQEGVEHFEVEPIGEAAGSWARYTLTDGTHHEQLIEERIVYADPTANRSTTITGSGEKELTLVLQSDENGEPVVVVVDQ